MTDTNKVLVIKLSALGDFVQCFGAMRAIRNNHSNANITLLTTKPYADLAQQSGYFNDVIIDTRPKLFQLKSWLHLGQKLNTEKFNRVYDLQCNDRTNIYFKLFLKKPEWFGTAKGASHRNISPTRKNDLAFYGHKQTLALAGIKNVKIDKLKWMNTDISAFPLTTPYVLITAGCAPSRPEKKWDSQNYGNLCIALVNQGLQPVLLGTESEKDINKNIVEHCPEALDLTQKTNLFDIPTLARKAAFAIGNDTGPMHFIGPTNCKALVLFSGSSDPKRHRPLGENVDTIQQENINDISVKYVLGKLNLPT